MGDLERAKYERSRVGDMSIKGHLSKLEYELKMDKEKAEMIKMDQEDQIRSGLEKVHTIHVHVHVLFKLAEFTCTCVQLYMYITTCSMHMCTCTCIYIFLIFLIFSLL